MKSLKKSQARPRLALAFLLVTVSASSATGIELFHRHWTEHYLSDPEMDDESVQRARRLGCYVCHVKGKSKKSHRNEYGQALAHYLDADDFPEDWVQENPEAAKRKIIAAFQQVEEDLKDESLLTR